MDSTCRRLVSLSDLTSGMLLRPTVVNDGLLTRILHERIGAHSMIAVENLSYVSVCWCMPTSNQLEMPLVGDMIRPSVARFACASAEERGEVFTKPEVAGFILDLLKWGVNPLSESERLLEPSCGSGDFFLPALERMLAGNADHSFRNLKHRLLGVEINREAFDQLRVRVEETLERHGFPKQDTGRLADGWLQCADFLSEPIRGSFSHVVGNPPYLRLEALPRELMTFYRNRFSTMYDRSDLYIAFFEQGLSLLAPAGRLGYICADRWMKNKYGGPLRRLIAEKYHLETYVDFTGHDAFLNEVSAYPAVTILRYGKDRTTRIVQKSEVDLDRLPELASALRSPRKDNRVQCLPDIASSDAPWLLSCGQRLEVIRGLEARFPTLEETGCRVGIGVATGADKVYIGTEAELDVEPDRKLPLLTRRDLKGNHIEWTGRYVLNPFDEQGKGLVGLDDYPKFKAYVTAHREQIERRHVARRNPGGWFKTIDRIYPDLVETPKLLIPDIQGAHQVVYDKGQYYPHHNLYFITSDDWDLRALQTVLRSRLALAFVATYSLRMRGDFIRFQAQYLRRIRVPEWSRVPVQLREKLQNLAVSEDRDAIDEPVRKLYGLDGTAWKSLTAS